MFTYPAPLLVPPAPCRKRFCCWVVDGQTPEPEPTVYSLPRLRFCLAQVETGTPYMLYKDACNFKSNQKNLGTIKSSNLCTEIVEYTAPDEVSHLICCWKNASDVALGNRT